MDYLTKAPRIRSPSEPVILFMKESKCRPVRGLEVATDAAHVWANTDEEDARL